MTKKYAKFQRIDNSYLITKETNDYFMYHLQKSLLLMLQEQGILNIMQYRCADAQLEMQRRDWINKTKRNGEHI